MAKVKKWKPIKFLEEEEYEIDKSKWYADLNGGIVHSENDYWKFYPEWESLRYYLTLKYGSAISGGLTRLVFKTKTGVCKLSYPECAWANDQENLCKEFPVAKNRLNELGDVGTREGISILMMEWVEESKWRSDYPDWVGYIDGAQVGYNRSGELVAFDAAT